MEDLRDAEKTVWEFTRLIDDLRPDGSESSVEDLLQLEMRTEGNGANGSQRGTRNSVSSRWRNRSFKKGWDETVQGILWNELEHSQNQVAQKFKIDDKTALKEYISCPEMMELGCEFARHYWGDPVREKAYWAAEDLFFELQAIKEGDKEAGRWAEAKVYKKEWDLADHIVRFVLLADRCRLCSGQQKWADWQWNFAANVCFYLSILRCYTIRDARQRDLAKHSLAGRHLSSPIQHNWDRSPAHSQSSSLTLRTPTRPSLRERQRGYQSF
ncbi:hypothetical protein GGS24DRAFT_499647 [Hypoxylon argillaceum]|nr:hypothetical protein GGS24DRAFT_499647 [Hypoxylon argillaceum]